MTQEIINITKRIAQNFGFEPAVLLAFIEVETGGRGFDPVTGKFVPAIGFGVSYNLIRF